MQRSTANMMKAIVIEKYGGPDVLQYVDMTMPTFSEDEVLVENAFIGVNYIDIYHRTGSYSTQLPAILGREASGRVDKVGKNVKGILVGDAVAYCGVPGTYAEYTPVHWQKIAKVPEQIPLGIAAAAMLQGLTTHYLVKTSYKVKRGDTVLIHAAAGGVGLLLCQICKTLGAHVIGTVSSQEKEQIARQHGATDVINYSSGKFASEVMRLTDNKGVHVVYDGVGKTTFQQSLTCLRTRGTMVSFGSASGPVEDITLAGLMKNSITLTRPSLMDFIEDYDEFLSRTKELFSWIEQRQLEILIPKSYPLKDAKHAHIDLEGRKTTGKIILIP